MSTPDDLFEAYIRKGGIRPDGIVDFWLPATRRPAAPVLTSNYGILYRRRFDDAQRDFIRSEKRARAADIAGSSGTGGKG